MTTTTIFPAHHHHPSDQAYHPAQTATHHHQPAHSVTTAVVAAPIALVSAMVSRVVAIESSSIVEALDVVTATTQAHVVLLMTSTRLLNPDVKASLFADSESSNSGSGVFFVAREKAKNGRTAVSFLRSY